MKIISRALVAAGAAVVPGVGFPLNAQAAFGSFIYHTLPGGDANSLEDPVDEECYALGRAGGIVMNNTDTRAFLYTGPKCSGELAAVIDVGQTPVEVQQFGSVRLSD
ncbi:MULTISPECIES: hypothetical protein [unclassified Streptomyces]|uniref:hypothetical protein n=1 Tax=unclassified Streptomyces TaxID=2593676 RepID=UPI0037F12BA6